MTQIFKKKKKISYTRPFVRPTVTHRTKIDPQMRAVTFIHLAIDAKQLSTKWRRANSQILAHLLLQLMVSHKRFIIYHA